MEKTLSNALLFGGDVLPTCKHYADLLDLLHIRTGMDYETMRDKYGLYTYKQWFELLSDTRMNMPITYHRPPTRAEIKFGYGAEHYRQFEMADVLTEDGRIKKWFKDKDDGLRYYR